MASKLKTNHIDWTKHKENFGLATQTLASSVTTAIDFLQKETNLSEFGGSEATTEFIGKLDMAYDMLNSRHPFAKGFKVAVSLDNLSMWMQQCDKLASYLLALKDKKGNFPERMGKRRLF